MKTFKEFIKRYKYYNLNLFTYNIKKKICKEIFNETFKNTIKILYHGSKKNLTIGDNLKTPTGRSEMNVTSGGVVYLTEFPEDCKRYGDVYAVEVFNAIPYKKIRELQGLKPKKNRYTKNVWVALPENTKIIKKL